MIKYFELKHICLNYLEKNEKFNVSQFYEICIMQVKTQTITIKIWTFLCIPFHPDFTEFLRSKVASLYHLY